MTIAADLTALDALAERYDETRDRVLTGSLEGNIAEAAYVAAGRVFLRHVLGAYGAYAADEYTEEQVDAATAKIEAAAPARIVAVLRGVEFGVMRRHFSAEIAAFVVRQI